MRNKKLVFSLSNRDNFIKLKYSYIINIISGTSKILATFKLERKSDFRWLLEKLWNENLKGNSLSFFNMQSVLKGCT